VLAARDDVRLTARDIREGEHWEAKLSDEVRSSDIFVIVLSPDSLCSEWVVRELEVAWGTCRAIVPIKTQPDLRIPVAVDGLMCFEVEKVLKTESWDRILAAFSGVRKGQWFNFLTKNPLE
jgi:hypothetical protein